MSEAAKKGGSAKVFLVKYSPVIILAALVVVSSIISPVFLSVQNIYNVLRQQAPYIMVALGVLMTILTGGIDLSAGFLISVSHVFLAAAAAWWGFATGGGIVVAIILCLAVGLAFGCVNGLLVAKLKLAAFIATLAVMMIAKGLSYIITGGSPIKLPFEVEGAEGSTGLIEFGQIGDPLFGLPLAVWLAIGVIIVFWFMMNQTMFGRMIVASGSNKQAVHLAGVNVDKYIFSAYAISGLMAGVAGMLIAARAGVATSTNGDGYELDAIAACVIGGASLAGGKGGVLMTICGVLIMGLIGNIMNLLSVASYPQQIIKGLIIIGAVVMNGMTQKDE